MSVFNCIQQFITIVNNCQQLETIGNYWEQLGKDGEFDHDPRDTFSQKPDFLEEQRLHGKNIIMNCNDLLIHFK